MLGIFALYTMTFLNLYTSMIIVGLWNADLLQCLKNGDFPSCLGQRSAKWLFTIFESSCYLFNHPKVEAFRM